MQLLLYLAIIPVVLLLKFIYNKDIDKEPRNLLKKIFITGILSVIPVIIFELVLGKVFPTEDISDPWTIFLNTFISIAIIEEGFKFLSAYIFTRNNKEFNHRYDAIVYCVFAALGFAVVENILYVITGGLGTAVTRALISVPSHACDAVIMGLFYGLSQEQKAKSNYISSIMFILIGILIPSIEHAAFDGLLSLAVVNEEMGVSSYSYLIILIIMVLITYVICFIIVGVTAKHKINFDGTIVETKPIVNVQTNATPGTTTSTTPNISTNNTGIRYCAYCGNQITGNFCTNCGAPRQ